MSKKQGNFPVTKSCKPMPPKGSEDWIIWAAWADRITFEEIFKITGKKESDVIRIMRNNLKASSFRKWRARASQVSHKHRKKFQALRQDLEIN
jgi:uncharacterized protein (TIGR03643 family)